MSDINPYTTSANPFNHPANHEDWPRRVKIEPVELCKRSIALMGEQYWLFVGLGLVAILIGSVVPFGILQGPMMVGYFLCFLAREKNKIASFDTLFKGFDQFGNALIAYLLIFVFMIVLFLPLTFIGILGIVGLGALLGPDSGGGIAIVGVLFFGALVLIVSFLSYVPILFAFPLIADQNMPGVDAVRLSFKGAMRNFDGLVFLVFVLGAVGVLALLCCYIPVFLWFPVASGAILLVYRDIFGPTPSQPQSV
jgi:hypothetical protein